MNGFADSGAECRRSPARYTLRSVDVEAKVQSFAKRRQSMASDDVREIKSRLDIVEIVSEYVKLKRNGRTFLNFARPLRGLPKGPVLRCREDSRILRRSV